MIDSKIRHFLSKRLKEKHNYVQLTITWEYTNHSLEFIGRKKSGKEYKGLAKLTGQVFMVQERPALPYIQGSLNRYKISLV